jgi:hypothetical protein
MVYSFSDNIKFASKMAEKQSTGIPVCTICFEVPQVLKVIPMCNHAFCRECLAKHVKRLSGSFPCPTCRAESPLPEDGVGGLKDYAGDNDIRVIDLTGVTSEQEAEIEIDRAKTKQIKCKICRFTKKTETEADHVCTECHNLYLCKDCTHLHRISKATEYHDLTPLKNNKIEVKIVNCETHEHLITSFCCTCSEPVCPICIQIDHSQHTIKRIMAVFNAKVEEMKCTKAKLEKQSKHVKFCQSELRGLKNLAQEREVYMMGTVEDNADKCIEHVIKQKADIKKKIVAAFKPILEVTSHLDNFQDSIVRMDESVTKAQRVLSDAEPSSSGLVKLYSVSNDMDEAGKSVDDIDREHYWQSYKELWQNLPCFIPNVKEYTCNLGKLSELRSAKDLESAFEKKLDVDDAAKFIPSITQIGRGREYYAIARPTTEGKPPDILPSDAIDIFKYPFRFQRTIREHVNSVYDMSTTPDGNLAVLSDGNTEDTCSVKLFHPETGFLRQVQSTEDFAFREVLSLAINLQHQYVVLSKARKCRMVTIFNEDGSTELTHHIEVMKFDISSNARRIACSARYIYIMGILAFAIYEYEIQKKEITLRMTSDAGIADGGIMKDISTTYFDQLAICYNVAEKDDCIKIFKYSNNQLLHLNTMKYRNKPVGANSESRLSMKDNQTVLSQGYIQIVSSQGCIIRVMQTEQLSIP